MINITVLDGYFILTQVITNIGNGAWSGYIYTFGYDAMTRLNSAANSNSAYGESYTYNQDGGIATKTRNGTSISYSYVAGTHKLFTAGSGSHQTRASL